MDIFQDLFPGCHLAITSMNNVISAGGPKQPFILDISIISIHLSIFLNSKDPHIFFTLVLTHKYVYKRRYNTLVMVKSLWRRDTVSREDY